jgi:hypothetical protein
MGATRELRVGFVALTDCAPLVIAKERGFFPRPLAALGHDVVVPGQDARERVVVAGEPGGGGRGGDRGDAVGGGAHEVSPGCVSIWAFWSRPE